MARRIPRLSESYHMQAEWYLLRYESGQLQDHTTPSAVGGIGGPTHHSVWFYIMAAWFYEDEDEQLANS